MGLGLVFSSLIVAELNAKVMFLSRAWATCVSVFVLPKQNYHNQVRSLLYLFIVFCSILMKIALISISPFS